MTIAPVPPQLALVERKYATVRRALVVEAGVLVTIGVWLTVLELVADVTLGGLNWLIAVALALAPIPGLLALGIWLDRFEPEPVWLLARTFLWGAGVAVFISGIVNGVIWLAYGKFVVTVIGAPLFEEAMKGLAVLHVFRWRREHLNGVTDGIVYALFVGLGFAVVENVQYYGAAIEESSTMLAITVGVRGLLTPLMHPFCTMFTGVGLGLVVSRRGAVRWIVPLAGYCLAASMHALWNSDIGVYLYPVLFVPGFVIVSVLLVRQRTHQRRLLESFIAPELSTGLIDFAVFERLRSGGGSLRVALASMRTSDHPLHAWRELHHAAYTLAMYRHNVVRRLHDGSPPTAESAETEALLRERVGAAARRARHLVDCTV
jgi:RsiW-degrading membrane proteinase PrsW (M82 family)